MDTQQQDRPLRLLSLTLPERGQANCHHAVIHSIKSRYPDVELHLGSQAEVASRVPPGVTFHPIEGTSLGRQMLSQKDGYVESRRDDIQLWRDITTSPGIVGFLRAVPLVSRMCSPDGADMVETAKDVERIIDEIQPDLVIIDSLFTAASDAARRLDRRWVTLSPNTVQHVIGGEQGWRLVLWPMVGTGWSYPLPWYYLPLNLLCILALPTFIFLFDTHFKATNKARNLAGYPGLMVPFSKRTQPLLCMTTPELDYPGYIPSDVICCGPILLPAKSLVEEDKELYNWVKGGTTVLVSLGSLLAVDKAYARAMLEAFRVVIGRRPDLQVLWKIRKYGENYPIDSGDERIKITDWLDVDPTTVLPHVACVVNHGGSNSYHEALAAGVPQVVLSPWYDCHDFGGRAEWLGVGKWGNRHAAPRCDAAEFTEALLGVVGRSKDDSTAMVIRQRARAVADVIDGTRSAESSTAGPVIAEHIKQGLKHKGRDVAADWVIGHARNTSAV